MYNLSGKRILVTGGSGFVGRHLLAALEPLAAVEVHAADRQRTGPAGGDQPDCAHRHELDVTRAADVEHLVAQVRPDIVIHLAAQAHVPTSFAEPEATWAVNLGGTLNLLAATRRHAAGATFLNVASADPYGASFRAGEAVTEQTPFLPLNPYAASKAAADLACYQEAATSGLRVIRARPFNHSGAGQDEGFVLPGFCAQIARIEAGLQEPVIRVGDLSAERDFLHIRDVVSAYLLLAGQAGDIEPGSAFNIASGRSWAIGDLLQQLIARSDRSIAIETDEARLRPSDIRRVSGSAEALRQAVGWQPQHAIEVLLDDLLGYWRAAVGQPA